MSFTVDGLDKSCLSSFTIDGLDRSCVLLFLKFPRILPLGWDLSCLAVPERSWLVFWGSGEICLASSRAGQIMLLAVPGLDRCVYLSLVLEDGHWSAVTPSLSKS